MKIKNLLFLAASGILFSACNNSTQSTTSGSDSSAVADSAKHELVLKWETDSLLKVPEAVLLDKANNVLYVSNIDGKDPWGLMAKGQLVRWDWTERSFQPIG